MGLFSFLAGLALPPTWVGRLQLTVSPNRYAPNLPGQQAVAAAQLAAAPAVAGRLTGDLLDGLAAGGEADYWSVHAQRPGYLEPIGQPVGTAWPMPPSWYRAGDPGRDGRPTAAADFGPSSALPHRNMTAWGGSTRTVNTGRQHVLAGSLNPPGAATPSAKSVYGAGAARGDVVDRLWSD